MKQKNYKQTLLACYLGFIIQAISANFLPLLYITFHKSYGIGFGKLALLSTEFFLTQLVVDFICAKIVDKIGYRPCIIVAQITSALGIAGLAFMPDMLPSPFVGIAICVFIYAIGSGLIEVLCSPIVEACPFENKEGAMSLLHSFYCWGFAGVIIFSTLFFTIFGIENWKILAIIWSIIPIYNTYNFAKCPIEKLVEDGNSMTMGQLLKTKVFWLFILLMIGAGASEISLAQWASAFAESALHVSKATGDLIGPCGFAIFMGLSRALYGKFGEKVNLTVFMALSGIMCLGCYLVAGITKIPVLGLISCALCGFSVGIMWPGSISISSSILKRGGTALFAFLALAGDLGGSIGPFVVGSVSQKLGDNLQAGVLSGIAFPIILVVSVLLLRNKYKEHHRS
ncbi:MFS transporter [Eubacterium coprostanoligenes]|uniref:MFS transporter n=1 Tax=Eubacterium coprostanoligenes TaxID=290054 RepID=UPI002355F0A3|nr:MFS transporter [Eubacterium coprostanoligenes]MCI5514778.1 MFS transporter [Oscillospiraceae bacterium]MCI6254308.1 MFS transporter [Eubacterium coprostanoligenes]MDY5400148.1 MFS transporter [Eubacterium coprostanoligenes]